METIIARAIDLLDKQLEPSSRERHPGFYLFRLHDGLKRLLETNLIETDHVRLFCRQINRLMDYNDSLSHDVWLEWHDDVVSLLNGPNSYQLKNDSWERTQEKMELEKKSQEYEFEFQKKFGERKRFDELFSGHQCFLQNYLRKCSSFHSTIEIRGLSENMNKFFDHFDQKAGVSLTSQQRKSLEEKFKSIEIDLDCSKKVLQACEFTVSKKNNRNQFLPSTKQIVISKYGEFETIETILKSNRWVVILGDPGSSKTTLLRWITRFFAERALRNAEEFLRIPILIRIGEFAAWLSYSPTKTLMDYIGEHRWFSTPYCQDDGQTILQEFVNHGHALILLDGLDEIPHIEQRDKILHLIRDFLEEHGRASDFTSAFNNKIIIRRRLHYEETMGAWRPSRTTPIETPLPSKSVGNQIIVTSRFVGYRSNPLFSPFIAHYSLLSMKLDEAKDFVDKWMRLVEEKVFDIFEHEGIQFDGEIREDLSRTRASNIKSMFQNKSQLLLSNPSLLSLICTIIFQSFDHIQFQSRAELYEHVVQRSFSFWKKDQSHIPEDVFTKFLINLATYLHLNSQSGLIDAFDIKLLSRLTLQQLYSSSNRRQLQNDADQLLRSLEHNVAFIVERGFQVYGFQHLSFEEYFVAQALLNHSSITQIVQCVLSLAQDFRFHESLLLTIGLISFKWSLNDYNQFCHDLVISTGNNSIPFGTLLLFHAFNDMKILPSDAVIHTALNNLFNHSSNMIKATYFLWNLVQVPDHLLVQWMQSTLNDNESIFEFCRCLFRKYPRKSQQSLENVQQLPSVMYQQLWSFHTRNSSIEFMIDQVLRGAVVRDHITEQIFNQDISSYLSSRDIHPLILSVISAVCGGVYYHLDDDFILQISFSTKQMHRESSIFAPLIDYFSTENNNEPHSRQIQTLINYYQCFLDNCSILDTSTIVVDSFIALICLQGLSQTSIYEKYQGYQAFPLALERFKWNWFHLMISGSLIDLGTGFRKQSTCLQFELQLILDLFSTQSSQSSWKAKSFFVACVTAMMKLRAFNMTDLFDIPNPYYFTIEQETSSHDDPLLKYLPRSLRGLYSCMIVSSTNRTDSIPFVVFLLECLKRLNATRQDDQIHYDGLSELKPFLIEHSLENYALAMFRDRYSKIEDYHPNPQLFDLQSFDWQVLVDQERQRIYQNTQTIQSDEKDRRLFAASICLAQICRSQYKLDELHIQKRKILSYPENENIHLAITNISEPILRILVISTILEINDPWIFNEEQRDQFRDEMLALFVSLLPDLSLSTTTCLFIQCHKERLLFPALFEEISTIIAKKFLPSSQDTDGKEREAAFIALRQLNDADLSFSLAEFAKQSNNLSDLLHFNSNIFHDYFMQTTAYGSSNISLLATMYLTELTFDVQNLRIDIPDQCEKERHLLTKQFEQLWNESSRWKKIMTLKLAKWITENLLKLSKTSISRIVKCLSECVAIEKEALPIINDWIKYRGNKVYQDFAHYATIELLIEGSDNPYLIDILNDILSMKKYSRIEFLADRLFNSPLIKSSIIQQILTALKEDVDDLSQISISINRQDILQIILRLQFEQSTSNKTPGKKISIPSLISIVNGCSKDLQNYLLDYFSTLIDELVLVPNPMKEDYLAILLTWTIECAIHSDKREEFSMDLYKYIFTLIHQQRFPRIQYAIAKAIDRMFSSENTLKDDMFMRNLIRVHLEKVISFWNIYPLDLLSICLLSFGNCLLRLRLTQKNYQISVNMRKVLRKICKLFFPRTVLIRARFCLIFSNDLNETRTTIINQFQKEWNVTLEMEYEILVENTFYRRNNKVLMIEEIVQCFSEHPRTMDMFVTDFYHYLQNDENNEYISDRTPDYFQIMEDIQDKVQKSFCNAVRKSSFGEENFKRKLHQHSITHPKDCVKSIRLYSSFGILTVELLDMLDTLDGYPSFKDSLSHFRQISDRDAVDKLFRLLNRKRYFPIFNELLSILRIFIQENVISLLEVHRKLPLVGNRSYESAFQWRSEEENIFDFFLGISSFTNDRDVLHVQTILTTTDLIDAEFDQQMNLMNNTLNLACGAKSSVGLLCPKPVRIRYGS